MVTQPKPVSALEQHLPQNIGAEFGVLGSILIDPEAITLVAGFLRANDFYRDANRTIYETILSLYSSHIPADFITLVDTLERSNKLEEIGGPGYITALIDQVPTSGNVEYYGHIVHNAATMRNLANASGTIAALAYSDLEATEALEQASQEIYSISAEQGLAQNDFSPDSVIADDVLSRLLSMQGKYGALTGIPTGFKDLDRLLGGLQRSDLIILAARPAIGKSSMALSLARHAVLKAMRNVAIFTLEMSKEQLILRLISMDAKVDLQRLRTNWIEDEEWEQLLLSRDRISTNRLWIDDTASISTIAMYSKLRRLMARQPIDLVIVDYLQLMTVVGSNSENRVQVLGEITRNLKAFAREFNVPVLALAQLSRKVDERQSKIPQLSDLRESGCLTGDTQIYLPDRGVYCQIKDLVGQSGFRVLALNTETWKLEPRIVTHAFSTGKKQTYKITTRLGRTIRATANHRFLTIHGWKRLDELNDGMHLALPRTLPSPSNRSMTDAELALLGHLSGTGLYKQNLGRERAGRLASIVSSEPLAQLAQSEVYWDSIISILPDEETEVFDLTVEGLHNFVANDLIAHNSIENDADVVLFIYRDEVYNPESERKGMADIIVAKHRNGPVGEITVGFEGRYTEFRDIDFYSPAEGVEVDDDIDE